MMDVKKLIFCGQLNDQKILNEYNFKKTKAAQSASQGQAKDQKKFSEAEQYKPCFAESNIKIAHSLLEL